MPLLPVVGHVALREKLASAIARGSLPSSLLLHGPRGVGKERLALWTAARLLCGDARGTEPCGACRNCLLLARGVHPDLHWYFSRPHLKANADLDDVIADLAEAADDRLLKDGGIWAPTEPTEALYTETIRALVRRASLTPAMASRKVIVVADADRLSPQESSEEASNAFLKLLEEPLADTTIVLTTSVPSALLPTIRSRVSAVRVTALSEDEQSELENAGVRRDEQASARAAASALLDAAGRDAQARYRLAFCQGPAGARGEFSQMLDALTPLLCDRMRESARAGRDARAVNAARAMEIVERAKRLARQNVNPQLISANLLNDLAPLVG